MHGQPQHYVCGVSSLQKIEDGRRRDWRHEAAGKLFSAKRRICYCGSLCIPSRTEQVVEGGVRPRELGILRPVTGKPERALDSVLVDHRGYIEKDRSIPVAELNQIEKHLRFPRVGDCCDVVKAVPRHSAGPDARTAGKGQQYGYRE